MTLERNFGLDERDFIERGGSIPIFVKHFSTVATMTVSGLHDEAGHDIIIGALKGRFY